LGEEIVGAAASAREARRMAEEKRSNVEEDRGIVEVIRFDFRELDSRSERE
jgi:hypothetical protein